MCTLSFLFGPQVFSYLANEIYGPCFIRTRSQLSPPASSMHPLPALSELSHLISFYLLPQSTDMLAPLLSCIFYPLDDNVRRVNKAR